MCNFASYFLCEALFLGDFMNKNKTNIKKISVTAMLCALAYLCVFLLKFKVSFLTFDFKDAVISIISFLYGPIYGVLSSGLVAFMEFVSVSDTGVYGLIMNFLSSGCFALVCGTVYKFKRTFFGAVAGAVLAAVTVTAVMLIANLFVTPFYMGVSRADVAALIPTLLLPFNLCKCFINAAVTMIIYKPITHGLKKAKLVNRSNADYKIFDTKTIILTVCSVAVIILSILVILFILKGSINFY